MTDAPAPPAALIRTAADADGPGLAALIAGIFQDYPDCPFLPEEFPELAAPASHYAGRGGALWVAEADGAVVGSLAVTPSWRAGETELFKVYLARSWRGRGIAQELLARALAFSRERGAHRVGLWSDTRFVEGHRFYRRTGFLQKPGARALHDTGRTLEYRFERELG
ncbi:MAG: GNAT family N-acetyltransferase [Alsobacter sp.]